MREQQFIRFVQQTCYLLKLSQPCSKTALQYFMQFKEYENHGYDQEILVAACIYLSVKIFEEEVRIRDILNMIYVLTSLYKMSAQQAYNHAEKKQDEKDKIEEDGNVNAADKPSQYHQRLEKPSIQQPTKSHTQPTQPLYNDSSQQQQPYILLKNIQHLQNLHQLIQPTYSLANYNSYKSKIIQAEQMLLRILGFSFSLSEENKKQLKRLLIVLHHLRIPPTIAETIVKVYNDLHYVDIDYWPEGLVYFGFFVTKVMLDEKQAKQSHSTLIQDPTVPKNPDSKPLQNEENLQLKEFKSTASQKKTSDKETAQIIRIKSFIASMTVNKWQTLLATDIKKLQNYAQKLANFYSSINPTS